MSEDSSEPREAVSEEDWLPSDDQAGSEGVMERAELNDEDEEDNEDEEQAEEEVTLILLRLPSALRAIPSL